jgi:hypothetical protein
MKNQKRNLYVIIIGIIILLAILPSWNYSTFLGIKNNTGYTHGKIVKNWKSGKNRHDYSRYEYKVNGVTIQGRQGGNFSKEKIVVIVYDKENPKYSMIAEYPFPLLNEKNDTLEIDNNLVRYSWWNYLPADKFSDLWKK